MINYLEHHIVDHCNLKCAGCSHFSSLVEEPWFESIEQFEKDFAELARKTPVTTIRLMGGEPLLHPQVGEFLKIARKLFPFSQIQLVTNGILLKEKSGELSKIANDLNILICVSNYGLNFNLKNVLAPFKYTRIDEKSELYNPSLDINGSQDPIKSFSDCDLHQYKWYFFQDGRFYPCCVMANINYFTKFFKLEPIVENINEVSISIYDHSIEEVQQFLNTPFNVCRYCKPSNRDKSYTPFHCTKKEIKEWIYQ